MISILKNYEQFSQIKTIPDMPVILRIDGRYFSKYTKELKLRKPFDIRLRDIFIEVSKDLMNEFNPKYIYTFSDELNLLLENIPFNGRVEKINSTLASYTASSFTKHLFLNRQEFDVDITTLNNVSFDCRIITPYMKIREYFKWRQDEAWRNCLNSYAQYILNKTNTNQKTAEKLYKLKKQQIHDLLYSHNINITNVPTWQKRGIAVYKKKQETTGYNPKLKEKNISIRNKIYVDTEITKL